MTDFSKFIREVPDFPQPGILFKDITPLLQDSQAFRDAVDTMAAHYESKNIDVIIGIDARGFIFGSALAYRLGVSFVPVRKSGKLPYRTHEASYELEYGTDTLAIHQDACSPGSHVLICDDVIATGGTIAATISLVEKLGSEVAGIAVLIELAFLDGREKFSDHDIFSLIEF